MKDGRRKEGRTHLNDIEPTLIENELNMLQLNWGVNVMMRKILLWFEKEDEREHQKRKMIFRTKCKIEGKCCNLIIDGGSSENLVST